MALLFCRIEATSPGVEQQTYRWAPRLVLLVTLVATSACSVQPTAANPTRSDPCGAGDVAGCERAMLAASPAALPRMVDGYASAAGQSGWRDLLARLAGPRSGDAKPILLRNGYVGNTRRVAAPPSFDAIDIDLAPKAVALSRLVLALGSVGHRPLVALVDAGAVTLLFPNDALAPHALALAAELASSPQSLASDAEIARAVDTALAAAGRYDYVAAARAATRLSDLLARTAGRGEGWRRGRYALALLERASLTLDGGAELGDLPVAEPSSAYAALIAVELAAEPATAWPRHSKSITAELGAAREPLLAALYAPKGACRAPPMPRFDGPGDVLFAPLLAAALEPPRASTGVTKPHVADWPVRHATLTRLVERGGVVWAHLDSLLSPGSRNLDSAVATTASAGLERVWLVGQRHVRALEQLSRAEPERFPLHAVARLLSGPATGGVRRDAKFDGAVGSLADEAVRLKLQAATKPDEVLRVVLTALAMAASTSRGRGLVELHAALVAKLEEAFGQRPGWGMAGLHASDAALGSFLDKPERLAVAAPRIASVLGGSDIAYPQLAKLVAAATSYATLARAGQLDPTVANDAMFPPGRLAARRSLGEAVAELSGTPSTHLAPAERELAHALVALADGLAAALAARLSEKAVVSCPGQGRIGKEHPLRVSYDRLSKQRRRMLETRLFGAAEQTDNRPSGAAKQTDNRPSGFGARARMLGLVLSDALDLLDDRTGSARFEIDSAHAEAILEAGWRGWLEPAHADLAVGGYLLARAVMGGSGARQSGAGKSAARALSALATLLAGGDAGALFGMLAELAGSIQWQDDSAALDQLMFARARRAYGDRQTERGDLMLMLALAVSQAREASIDDAVVDLAAANDPRLVLPLLLHTPGAKGSGDPRPLALAAEAAVHASCSRAVPGGVLAMRRAIHDLAAGRASQARAALGQWLARAEHEGLDVPRQTVRFGHRAGDLMLSVEESVSLGNQLLKGSSKLVLGVGLVLGRGGGRTATQVTMGFVDPDSNAARDEAARYFAHAAAISSVLHFLAGEEERAIRDATRAVGTWVNGVRLGAARAPAEGQTAGWASDAVAVLAIAGQLAAESGHAVLAGDLWALARAGLPEGASDDEVRSALEPPAALVGIAELRAVASRAAQSLELVFSRLPCTHRKRDAAPFERVECSRYPVALALRAADGLAHLPRLKTGGVGSDRTCVAWSALDAFLAAKELGQYDPDRFNTALDELSRAERWHDAASLVARQRHPRHCTVPIVAHARRLAEREELGVHLRADLLSVAANCDGSGAIDSDLVKLDALTQRHALPLRNLEVITFAARVALESDRWQALRTISRGREFVARWRAVSAELGTAALMVSHAAAVGANEPIDGPDTRGQYRALCTTLPAAQRDPMCAAIAVLRSSATPDEKRRAGKAGLGDFVRQATEALRPK